MRALTTTAPFPLPTAAMAPLRAAAEAAGSDAFTPLWSGQAAAPGRDVSAGDVMRQLCAGVDALLQALPGRL